jgi:ABC-type lipoprotein release transport system permease subunit
MLFEVPSYDPLTFAGVVLLLTTVAMVSSYLPARRAAAIQPAMALRGH